MNSAQRPRTHVHVNVLLQILNTHTHNLHVCDWKQFFFCFIWFRFGSACVHRKYLDRAQIGRNRQENIIWTLIRFECAAALRSFFFIFYCRRHELVGPHWNTNKHEKSQCNISWRVWTRRQNIHNIKHKKMSICMMRMSYLIHNN